MYACIFIIYFNVDGSISSAIIFLLNMLVLLLVDYLPIEYYSSLIIFGEIV